MSIEKHGLRLALALAVVSALATSARAQCTGCGYGSRGAFVHTLPAETLSQGRWTLGARFDWMEFDPLSDAELASAAGSGMEVDSIDRSLMLRLGAAYGITSDINVGIDLPVIFNQDLAFTDMTMGTVEDGGDPQGFGDLSAFGSWRFLQTGAEPLSAALLVGIETPTGATHVDAPGGMRLMADQQPGSGSWDPFAGLSTSKEFGDWLVGASVLYTFAGDGDQDSNMGDHLNFGLGLGWAPGGDPLPESGAQSGGSAWLLMLELFGEWRDTMIMDGMADGNSGGTTVYLAPGVRTRLADGWSVYASLALPVAQDLDGTQEEVSWWATAGFSYSF